MLLSRFDDWKYSCNFFYHILGSILSPKVTSVISLLSICPKSGALHILHFFFLLLYPFTFENSIFLSVTNFHKELEKQVD